MTNSDEYYLNKHDLETLRACAGEHIPNYVAGAAHNVCCTHLRRMGFLDKIWNITAEGRALLAKIDKR